MYSESLYKVVFGERKYIYQGLKKYCLSKKPYYLNSTYDADQKVNHAIVKSHYI